MDIVFTAYWESDIDTPLVSPATLPVIRIRRLDTNAITDDNVNMIEVGDGVYKYLKTDVEIGLDYSVVADGDPNNTSQVVDGSRYAVQSVNLALSDLHEASFNTRRWDKANRKLFVYADSTRSEVLHEFDVNTDLSDITPVDN